MYRLGFAVLLVLALTVCAAAAPIEIEFHFVANQSEADAWYTLADMFNASQDDIVVVPYWDTGEWIGYQERMLVRIAANTPPHIMRLSDEALLVWADAGYLRPVGDWLERDIDLSEYLPIIDQLGSHRGTFYGFPQGLATRALAYNRVMFQNVGLAYPDDDWLWEEDLLDAARRLSTRDADDQPLTYAIGFHTGGAGNLRKDIPEILWAFGGEVFDAQGNMRLADDESIEALTFIQRLISEYRVFPEDFDVVGRFLNGTLAMWNTGVWDVNLLRQQPSLDFDFAPTPGGPAGHFSFIQGNGIYVIPAVVDDEKAAAAWEFMKFLVSEEAQRVFGLEYGIGGVPLVTSLVPEYVAQASPPDNWEAFVTSVQRGRMVYHPANATEIFNALNVGWDEMIRGNTPVRAWLDAVAPVVKTILERSE